MTRQELIQQIFKKKSVLCVGLDTDLKKIPQHLLSCEDPIFESIFFSLAISSLWKLSIIFSMPFILLPILRKMF